MTAPSPDRSLAALAARHGKNYRWRLLLTVMIGSVASVMCSTIINVAVPDLSHYFEIGQDRAQWVAAGFMAAMTLSMLPTPWLLARYGFRRTYIGAVLLLTLGGVVGGLARHFDLVLAMRAAEGLAAGVLQVMPAIIVMRAFGEGERGRAMGVFGFSVALAPAIAPSLGGVLVEHMGWRSVFFFVVPFALWALWLAHRYLPEKASSPEGEKGAAIDAVGLALAAVAVLSLLNGLVHLHDTSKESALLLLGLCAASLGVFVWHESRTASPLMHLQLFRSRPFAMGGVVAFVYGMGLFGSTYLVPVFMQSALNFPPSQAGFALMPAGLVLAAAIPVGGRLADRFPAAALVAIGLALLALSFALMATVGLGTTLGVLMLWVAVGRVGLGFVLPSLTLGAMAGLAPAAVAQGASAISLLRQLGGATGVGVVGIFLEWRLRVHAAAGAPKETAFTDTFWLITALTALATVAALRMRARPDQVPQKVL